MGGWWCREITKCTYYYQLVTDISTTLGWIWNNTTDSHVLSVAEGQSTEDADDCSHSLICGEDEDEDDGIFKVGFIE